MDSATELSLPFSTKFCIYGENMNSVVISYNHFVPMIEALVQKSNDVAICNVGVNRLPDKTFELLVNSFSTTNILNAVKSFSDYSNRLVIYYFRNEDITAKSWQSFCLNYSDHFFNPLRKSYFGILHIRMNSDKGASIMNGLVIEPNRTMIKPLHCIRVI